MTEHRVATHAPEAGDFIALYGSLMQGLGAMDELALGDQLEFKGPALIQGALFDLGSYPGLRPGSGRVRAELYIILNPTILVTLDRFEGILPGRPEESYYRRKWLRLLEPSDTEAWVYFYNRTPSPAACITAGDWRAHLDQRTTN